MTESDYDQLKPQVIYVSQEAWDELQRRLAEPPKIIPELVELYRRHRLTEESGDGS